MSKHTPGPWFALPGANRGMWVDNGPGAFSIGDAPTTERANILCSRFEWRERFEEMEANARLIAASPDLLEALLAIDGCYRCGEDLNIVMDQARAAIAKTESEK